VRRLHFDALRPVCPVCRSQDGGAHSLRLAQVAAESADHVLEGVLNCSNPSCLHEYPIIDGIPIVVPNVRRFVADQILAIEARRDLGPVVESLIGDCCGPSSTIETTRQHLSTYAWGHYADLDPTEKLAVTDDAPRFSSLLAHARDLLENPPPGHVIDVGCSVGRGTFELASTAGGLVLGVDLNFAMLRLASEALHRGTLTYPRRRVGLVYDRRTIPVAFPGAARVDFWACDALALPFSDATFAAAVSMNLLDCVSDPHGLLVEFKRILRPGARAVLACPYDWSPSATAPEAWLGGHSQRSTFAGASESILRALLTPGAHPSAIEGLELTAERDGVTWTVRLHDRSTVNYRLHMVGLQRIERTGGR
jgi:SAM-dependent methyltransferase/uncharacterized protein YbaR (Trm112 family)